MGMAEFAAVSRAIRAGKVLFGNQLQRLRYDAVEGPTSNLRRPLDELYSSHRPCRQPHGRF